MDGSGVLIFDVNDFDEAYVGHFTWDLQRFAASVALMCWQKALSDDVISRLDRDFARAYVAQVQWFTEVEDDSTFSLNLDTATRRGAAPRCSTARLSTRAEMLDRMTGSTIVTAASGNCSGVRRLDDAERDKVNAASSATSTRSRRPSVSAESPTTSRMSSARPGFGHRQRRACRRYTVLIEGFNQALDNDVVLSMKQGNVAAPSRVVDDREVHEYFKHHGHRTAVSQRALQAHADPLLGYTEIDGIGSSSASSRRMRPTWTGAS